MRILHAIETIDQDTGGPAITVPALAAAQAALGHQVTVACLDRPTAQRDLNALRSLVPNLGAVQFAHLPWRGHRWLAPTNSALSWLRSKGNSQDIIQVHGVWRPFGAAWINAARKLHVPFVVTPHGMLDPWSLTQHAVRKRIALALYWRNTLGEAAFIHALNNDEARLLHPLHLGSPTSVHPNGVYPESFDTVPSPALFRDGCPALGSAPYVLFLARLHYKKGLDILVPAFELYALANPSIHLVIAGPDGGQLAALQQSVASSAVSGRIHLCGPLYGAAKYSAMTGAQSFCLPSRQEGFSVAVLEAMACGAPVVISEHCHFDDITAAGAGLVVPLSIADTARALGTYNEPVVRAQASQAARSLVLTRYTWPAIAQDMVRRYSAAINGAHSAR